MVWPYYSCLLPAHQRHHRIERAGSFLVNVTWIQVFAHTTRIYFRWNFYSALFAVVSAPQCFNVQSRFLLLCITIWNGRFSSERCALHCSHTCPTVAPSRSVDCTKNLVKYFQIASFSPLLHHSLSVINYKSDKNSAYFHDISPCIYFYRKQSSGISEEHEQRNEKRNDSIFLWVRRISKCVYFSGKSFDLDVIWCAICSILREMDLWEFPTCTFRAFPSVQNRQSKTILLRWCSSLWLRNLSDNVTFIGISTNDCLIKCNLQHWVNVLSR